MSIIEMSGIDVAYDDVVILDGLDLEIERGELVCLLGPSGCGKSTLLRILGDLAQPVRGQVRVADAGPESAWSHLGYVFQNPRLAPWRSALGNVTLGMKLRGVPGTRAEHRDRAEQALDTLGIRGLANRRAHALSGGEQQRVSIARALAVSPAVLLMDEPFSALDVQTRRRMRREIVDLWQRTGLTIVLVTHDIDEALEVASRVVVFSPKPTTVLADRAVPLEHPRDRRSEEFRALHDQLVALFDDPTMLDGPPS